MVTTVFTKKIVGESLEDDDDDDDENTEFHHSNL
jgi:hypothetical protein